MPDDAEYLRSYAETHDEESFATFVRQNVDLVYSAAFRQTGGDVHLAEDITQKVFVSAAQKAATLGRHPVVRAWLHQTTRYIAIDAVRARLRRQAREETAMQMNPALSEAPEPEGAVDWDRVSPELDQFVASLGARYRDAVILRFFGGKSFADIGAQLRIGESAARMRVERALEKLRSRLARRGIHSSCAALGALFAEKGLMAAPASLSAASVAAALNAPALGGIAAGLTAFKFMSTAKIIATGATAIALLSIVTAVHEHRLAATAEEALANATRLQAAARKEAPAPVPSPTPVRVQTQQDVAAPKEPAAMTLKESVPARPASPFAALLGVLSNPAMQQQTSLAAKVRLDAQYGELFKQLGLAPEGIDKFKNLLVEKQMVGFDSMAAAHDHGIDPVTNPQGFFQAVAVAERTVDTDIQSLLGDEKYAAFQTYQETVPARNTVNLLRQALNYTSNPLTNDQAERVTLLLSQNGKSPLGNNNPFAVLNGDLGITTLNETGMAQAQSLLSPPQFETLKEKMAQQLQLFNARARMGR